MADPATKPPASIEDVLAALRLVFAEVKKLRAEHAAAHPGIGGRGAASQQSSGGEGRVASDAEMAGQYGDPEIKKDPKRWKGESFKGSKMSECSPEFLDELAGFMDWKAAATREDASDASDGEERKKLLKFAGYNEKDAALARGWAKRKRAASQQSTPATRGKCDGSHALPQCSDAQCIHNRPPPEKAANGEDEFS